MNKASGGFPIFFGMLFINADKALATILAAACAIFKIDVDQWVLSVVGAGNDSFGHLDLVCHISLPYKLIPYR